MWVLARGCGGRGVPLKARKAKAATALQSLPGLKVGLERQVHGVTVYEAAMIMVG